MINRLLFYIKKLLHRGLSKNATKKDKFFQQKLYPKLSFILFKILLKQR